jgi:hypothetical protein
MDRLSRVLAGPLRMTGAKASAQPEWLVRSSLDVRSSGPALSAMATRLHSSTELKPWIGPESGAPRPLMSVEPAMLSPASPAPGAAASSAATAPVLPPASMHAASATPISASVAPWSGAVDRLPARSARIAEPARLEGPRPVMLPADEFRAQRAEQSHERSMPAHLNQEVRPAVSSPVALPPLAPASHGGVRPGAWRAIPEPPVRSERVVERIERVFERVVVQPIERQPAASAWDPHAAHVESGPVAADASRARRLEARTQAAPEQSAPALETTGKTTAKNALERTPLPAPESSRTGPMAEISQARAASRPGRRQEHLPLRPVTVTSVTGREMNERVAGATEPAAREPRAPGLAPRAPATHAASAPVPVAGPTAHLSVSAAPAPKSPARPVEPAPPIPRPAAAARPAARPAAPSSSRAALMVPTLPSPLAAPASPRRSQPVTAARPSIAISIGRVEIIAPEPRRATIPARAHQIDPGLHFGASTRGRL